VLSLKKGSRWPFLVYHASKREARAQQKSRPPSALGDESLAHLQTDHVDLCMIHWPGHSMRVVEVMQALNDSVTRGKTRFVGCYNYSAWLVAHSNLSSL
jgi:diketogulonate reductase-like aldo/keto reductase